MLDGVVDAFVVGCFDGLDDVGHDVDGFDRVFANGCFFGEHDCVGSVDDGVGDVGDLGSGGSGMVCHGFEHLCGCDDGLACLVALADDAFLEEWDAGGVGFDAEVAACHHQSVCCVEYFVEVFECGKVFDLGDYVHA